MRQAMLSGLGVLLLLLVVAFTGAVYVVDETGNVIYEWIAPNLGTEPDYAAVQAALA